LKQSRKHQTSFARLVVYAAFSTILGQLVRQLQNPYQYVFSVVLCVFCVGVFIWVLYEVYFRRHSSPELEEHVRRIRERDKS
jgi:cyanate permease